MSLVPFSYASVQASNWQKISKLIVYFCVVHSFKKEDRLENSHILSCLVQLKSVLFNLLCVFFIFGYNTFFLLLLPLFFFFLSCLHGPNHHCPSVNAFGSDLEMRPPSFQEILEQKLKQERKKCSQRTHITQNTIRVDDAESQNAD